MPSTRRPPCRSRPPTTHLRGTVPIHFARPLAPNLDNAFPTAGGSTVSWCEYSGSDQPWVKGSTQSRSRQLTRGDSSIGQQLCRVTPRLDHSRPMRHSSTREKLSLPPSNSRGRPRSAGVHVSGEKLSLGSRVAAPATIHRRVRFDPVVQVISGALLVEHSNSTVDHDHWDPSLSVAPRVGDGPLVVNRAVRHEPPPSRNTLENLPTAIGHDGTTQALDVPLPPSVPLMSSEVEPTKEVEAERFEPPSSLPIVCLLYTSPSPRDATLSRMPSSA